MLREEGLVEVASGEVLCTPFYAASFGWDALAPFYAVRVLRPEPEPDARSVARGEVVLGSTREAVEEESDRLRGLQEAIIYRDREITPPPKN